MDIKVFTIPGLEDEMTSFHAQYNVETIISPPDEKINNLKPKAERTCRFCGVSNDATKFKNIPHIIPQLLGNTHLVSDFECDDCNSHFGRYENDLAYSLGIMRTFYGTKGKGAVPGFQITQ
ncbi:HNH endonuclease [Mucilaginibacter sp. KACC 22773]|uniref:HNH endonuclease n=1 Tax=Mucilaginibacter sp. KACC 22773 TaxID=3025671 RepID=UPI002366DC62|nr:HNH endonuclease [Mucilaginibacter sp. KACC 22773]WDF77125.1 HNH endonuclease [Mucilaginibacter sp. KACC 22773]